MAERYHRIELGNSTLGLEPPFFPSRLLPGFETVVVPLPDDLPFAEFQKHGKKGLHLPPGRNGSKGYGQSSDPLNFQRYPVVVSYLLLYLIHLVGHHLSAAFRPLQGRSQVSLLSEGRQQVREFLQDYIGSKELLECGTSLPPFEGLQVSPRNPQISSRFAHFCLHKQRFSAACVVSSTGLSYLSVLLFTNTITYYLPFLLPPCYARFGRALICHEKVPTGSSLPNKSERSWNDAPINIRYHILLWRGPR